MSEFEILVVDDDEATVREITTTLNMLFEDLVRVWPANDVRTGKQIIERRAGRLAAAVLDFHFPTNVPPGYIIDESLCGIIRTLAPNTPVFHWTGFTNDALVRSHFRNLPFGWRPIFRFAEGARGGRP
jgi:CheY-like chemotaxis protein